MSSDFLKPGSAIEKWGEKLPHWTQGEVMQFVTFRLGDALPKEKVLHYVEQRRNWELTYPKPWSKEVETEYHKKFTWRLERWLDQGAGSCLLGEAAVRDIIIDVLMKFDGERVYHHAWVLMPNHVHLLFSPVDPLDGLIRAWKSISATLIGRGKIWQRNYRDTMIRDGEHFANAVRYIRNNPVKAHLPAGNFTLWESDRAKSVP
jgi:REP element-mobilizing transposase RayT